VAQSERGAEGWADGAVAEREGPEGRMGPVSRMRQRTTLVRPPQVPGTAHLSTSLEAAAGRQSKCDSRQSRGLARQSYCDHGAAETADGWKPPLASPRRPAGDDPNLPVRLLQSCPTLESTSFGFYVSEAAVRGHQDPALMESSP
jgi:hypothetical protein